MYLSFYKNTILSFQKIKPNPEQSILNCDTHFFFLQEAKKQFYLLGILTNLFCYSSRLHYKVGLVWKRATRLKMRTHTDLQVVYLQVEIALMMFRII